MVCGCFNRGRRVSGAMLGVAVLTGVAAATPDIASEVIGQTPGGKPIEVLTIADRDVGGRGPGERPAVAIIAGVQGHHQIGVRVAEMMGGLLIEDHADALAGRTVYIIPRVNPEGLARFASERSPRALSGRAPAPRDADRDRRVDEDPPNDLNGDGFITMMRVPAPDASYGLDPTHVVDGDDPRIVREAGDDESSTHALLIEGIDDDGDGRFNEDGWGGASGGGVDLDMHFPTHWPEHTDGAGRFPLDRPEALAVVQWLQSRGNIAAVIVLGPHDTIVSTPPTGKYGPDGRVPEGIESDDAPAYKLVAEAFEDLTGITKTEAGPSRAGSLVQWCYADLGVYAFGTPVWVRPDLVKQDQDPSGEEPVAAGGGDSEDTGPTPAQVEAADRADLADRNVGQMFIDFLYMDEAQRTGIMTDMASMSESDLADLMQQFTALPADVQARVRALQAGGEDPGPSEELIASITVDSPSAPGVASGSGGGSADAKWLAWLDGRGDGGFVEWEPFDHPQLGPVDIGGFVPGVRVNPPAELEDGLAAQQAAFAASVLGMLPDLAIDEPTVERVGSGVWRVGLTLRNTGTLPTKSAIGVKARRLPGIVCMLDPDQDLGVSRIVSGPRAIRFAAIEGRGATERAEWLVVGEAGDTVDLEVRSPLIGTARFELKMEAE